MSTYAYFIYTVQSTVSHVRAIISENIFPCLLLQRASNVLNRYQIFWFCCGLFTRSYIDLIYPDLRNDDTSILLITSSNKWAPLLYKTGHSIVKCENNIIAIFKDEICSIFLLKCSERPWILCGMKRLAFTSIFK